MTGDRRARELVGTCLWALVAVAWVVATAVPWFRSGVVASTTPLEVAGLLRSGVLDVPPVSAYAVLVLASQTSFAWPLAHHVLTMLMYLALAAHVGIGIHYARRRRAAGLGGLRRS